MGLITSKFWTSNISMAIKPYKISNTLIYKILFDLSESFKKICFKGIFGQIFEDKDTGKSKKQFSMTLTSIIRAKRSLNQVILDDSGRSNKIL